MEDVLHLRLSAIFGTGSFVLFYLVQKPIMVTPAAWGCLNLSINMFMTARLLAERRPVHFTVEELDTYEEHFRPFGCSARSFRLFWDKGKQKKFKAGDIIQLENTHVTSLSLVISGRVERSAHGKPIPALASYPGARENNPEGADAGAWIGELGMVQMLNNYQRQNRLVTAITTAASETLSPPPEQQQQEERRQQAEHSQEAPAPAEHVRRLHAMQRRLSALGFYDGRLDAKHGPKTERAVRDFQAAAGLKVDGIAGPQTVERMKASFKDAGLHKDGSAPSQSVFTSRAAADAVVVSWAFEDVIGLCADHPDLKQELRRAFSHSAVSKALGLARNHGVG